VCECKWRESLGLVLKTPLSQPCQRQGWFDPEPTKCADCTWWCRSWAELKNLLQMCVPWFQWHRYLPSTCRAVAPCKRRWPPRCDGSCMEETVLARVLRAPGVMGVMGELSTLSWRRAALRSGSIDSPEAHGAIDRWGGCMCPCHAVCPVGK
jgi:hypothetical protein